MIRTILARCPVIVAAALASTSFVPSSISAQVPKEMNPLWGTWFIASTEESGKAVPKSEWVQTSWRFDDKRASVRVKGRGALPDDVLYFSYTIDPNQNPARVLLYTDNPRIGFTCIYRLEKDAAGVETLTICFNPGGMARRPTEFKTTRDDTFTLITLRRDP